MSYSVVGTAAWDRIKPYLKVEIYDRDGGHANPRIRLEVNAPAGEADALLALTIPCVRCGEDIHPVRPRAAESPRSASGHFYYAVACPLDVCVGCSRGRKARDEYRAIRQALEAVSA